MRALAHGNDPAHRQAARLRLRTPTARKGDRRGPRPRPTCGVRGSAMSIQAMQVPKLLVIDANVFFAKRLSDALKSEGFEVVHSTQSSYGLTMLEWDPPAAILCSTNLRELPAFEIPSIVHADSKTAHIPIIAMGD